MSRGGKPQLYTLKIMEMNKVSLFENKYCVYENVIFTLQTFVRP